MRLIHLACGIQVFALIVSGCADAGMPNAASDELSRVDDTDFEQTASAMDEPSMLGEDDASTVNQENVCEAEDDESTESGMPSQQQCIDACKGGTAAIQAFCRILPEPRLRFGCWSVQFAGLAACLGWCYWNF